MREKKSYNVNCDRSECYIKENVTGRKFAGKSDQVRRPGPDRVRPVVTEDAPADVTGVAVIHGNYLEISGPRIPEVFLELAEEARNIVIVDGRSVNMKNAQLQRTGRTDPVFVAEIVNSCPMLRDGALVATGTSTEVIPNTDLREQSEPVNRSNRVGQLVSSDGRGVMVDRSDLVGQYNSPDQSAFPGLDVGRVENVSFIRRQPGAMMYQIQPVADGRQARIEHAAWCAQMGFSYYMTWIGRWLWAQWAQYCIQTRWALVGCHP